MPDNINVHTQANCFSCRKLHQEVSQCPARGSRVVFPSYKDCVGQIQKFAMRFPNSYEPHTFINSLKECLKDARNIGLPCCNLRSEVPSQTGVITSNDVHDRADQELGFVDLIGNYTPLMQSSLDYRSEEYAYYAEETTLLNDFGGMCEALPQSFTDLLAECCTEVEQDATEPPIVLEEVDLKSQTVIC